jgi:hypothetical protein
MGGWVQIMANYIVDYHDGGFDKSITDFIKHYNIHNRGMLEFSCSTDMVLDALRFSLTDVQNGRRLDSMVPKEALMSESYPGMILEESVRAAEIQLIYDKEDYNLKKNEYIDFLPLSYDESMKKFIIEFTTGAKGNGMERVLVFAPTSIEKEYCLEEYLGAYHSQTYENKELLLIDNSCGPYHYKDLSHREDTGTVMRCERRETLFDTIDECWLMALGYANQKNIRYIMSIESDILVPEDTIKYSMDIMQSEETSIVSHLVPARDGKSKMGYVLGCTLIDTNVTKGKDQWGDSDGAHFESRIYLRADHNGSGTYQTKELTPYIQHIDYPDIYREMVKTKWGEESGIVL